MEQDKVRENRARRQAGRLGLVLVKSRSRIWSVDDYLQWQIRHARLNTIEAGEKFNLTLEEVEAYLNEAEKELRQQATK
jgi:hypothetical protein